MFRPKALNRRWTIGGGFGSDGGGLALPKEKLETLVDAAVRLGSSPASKMVTRTSPVWRRFKPPSQRAGSPARAAPTTQPANTLSGQGGLVARSPGGTRVSVKSAMVRCAGGLARQAAEIHCSSPMVESSRVS